MHAERLALSERLVEMFRNPGLSLVQVGEDRRGGIMDASEPGLHVPPAGIDAMHSGQSDEDRDEKPIHEDKLTFLVIATRRKLNGL